jgi:PAS domain S-box-containing protein
MVANFAERSRRSGWLHVGVIVFVLAVCLLLVGTDVWRTWQDRTRAISENRIETTNLATSLAQHAHDVVQAADAALFAIRARAESDVELNIPLQRLHATMMARVANLSVVHGLFIFDAMGNRVVSSVPSDAGVINYSDRTYFQYHRTHADRCIHVGDPVHSKVDGSWIIPVSRRIDTPDGRFHGVAVATISIAFLQKFYDQFDVGRKGVITLESMNGIVIARRPYDGAEIGTDVSRGRIHRDFLKRLPTGSFRSVSPIDGIDRLGSYRRIADYPLVIIVAHDFGEVLADWRLDTGRHLAVSVGAAVALAFLGSRFARQIKIGQEAENSYRLLADNSSDAIVCASLSGRKLYVSPSFSKLTGWSVEEALRMQWGDMVHPDDRQASLDIKVQLLAEADVTIRYRYVCKDGSDLWVEARLQHIDGAEGPEVSYVANIRDITERKAAEDQIMALNGRLAAQANTDGLTDLANRGRFDGKHPVKTAVRLGQAAAAAFV